MGGSEAAPQAPEQNNAPSKAPTAAEAAAEREAKVNPKLPPSLDGFLEKLNLKEQFGKYLGKITAFLQSLGEGFSKFFKGQKENIEKQDKNVTESKESEPVSAQKVLVCGDSLAVGMGKEYKTEGAEVGASSGALLRLVEKGLFKRAKENGAKKVVISIGANDLDPNLDNIQAIVKEAKKYFAPEAIVLCGVPEYNKDSVYAGKWAKYGDKIKQYNANLEKNFPGIKIYRMPTDGLLHPNSYTGIVADLDKMLDVERKNA